MAPKDLNENVKRNHYHIPKQDKITREMSGENISQNVVPGGFWQTRLDGQIVRIKIIDGSITRPIPFLPDLF